MLVSGTIGNAGHDDSARKRPPAFMAGVPGALLGSGLAALLVLGALGAARRSAVRHGLVPEIDVEELHLRVSYAATFGVCFTVVLASYVKATATTSLRKREMATRLALHYAPICLAMLCCALGLVYVPRGPGGHRINVAALLAWSATSFR
jgi:hypothetical protein